MGTRKEVLPTVTSTALLKSSTPIAKEVTALHFPNIVRYKFFETNKRAVISKGM